MNPSEMRKIIIKQIFDDMASFSGLDSSRYDTEGMKIILEAFLSNTLNNQRIQKKLQQIQKLNHAEDLIAAVQIHSLLETNEWD